MKITLAIAIFLLLLPAQAATGGKGKGGLAAAPSAATTSAATGRGGSALRTMRDPRRAPELDPGRKINEQDCSKPIDFGAGNLRCK
jgi:hypothetical protein